MGMFNAGLSPLKPILFTLLAVGVTLASSLLNKPRFTPVVFLVLLLPLVRVFDAVVLKRAEVTYAGQTEMDMLRMLIVLIAILTVLTTDKGLQIALGAAVLSIFLTTGSEIVEMLGFAQFTEVPGRFSGFNGHPNFPPVLLCEMLGIAFALSKSFRFNCLLIATAYVGVGLTYGRSGFIVLTLMSGFYIADTTTGDSNLRNVLASMGLCKPLNQTPITFPSPTPTRTVTPSETPDSSPTPGKDGADGSDGAPGEPGERGEPAQALAGAAMSTSVTTSWPPGSPSARICSACS
jgi:hypothetical protein